MINAKKLALVAFVTALLLVAVGIVCFLGLHASHKSLPKELTSSATIAKKKATNTQKSSTVQEEQSSSSSAVSAPKELDTKSVQAFLEAYYTKDDYGTNRKAYQPYLTTGAYQAEVNDEDKQISLGLSGYLVDYRLEEATVYLNNDAKSALVELHYSYLPLTRQGDKTSAGDRVTEAGGLRLHYQEDKGHYVIDRIEKMVITPLNNLSAVSNAGATDSGHD